MGDKEYRRRLKWVASGSAIDYLPAAPIQDGLKGCPDGHEDVGFDAGGAGVPSEPFVEPKAKQASAPTSPKRATIPPIPLSWRTPPPKAAAVVPENGPAGSLFMGHAAASSSSAAAVVPDNGPSGSLPLLPPHPKPPSDDECDSGFEGDGRSIVTDWKTFLSQGHRG